MEQGAAENAGPGRSTLPRPPRACAGCALPMIGRCIRVGEWIKSHSWSVVRAVGFQIVIMSTP